MKKLYLIALFFVTSNWCLAKYGLRLFGQEYPIDDRTMCQFFINQPPELSDNFTIAFDFATIDDSYNEFGYIFRSFSNNGKKMDLIYQVVDGDFIKVSLLIGNQKQGEISLRIDRNTLKSWTRIKLDFDLQAHKYLIAIGEHSNQLHYQYFSSEDRLKFYFGINDHQSIATRDAINMKIRNVDFIIDGDFEARWPLTNVDGLKCPSEGGQYWAQLRNPKWIRKDFTFWKPLITKKLEGYAEVVFNTDQHKLYFIGGDRLLVIDPENIAEDSMVLYQNPVELERGHQNFIYDGIRKQLLAYSVDHMRLYPFDKEQLEWSEEFDFSMPDRTDYLHHNRYISPIDSGLYTIFGYGHHMFRKSISNFLDRTRDKNTDPFPRYLAGFGLNQENQKGYILGGFGNEYGEQKYSPHYFSQLMEYDLSNQSFKVLHTYDTSQSQGYFTSANSLVVEQDQFYAMLFKKNQFQSTLQLFKGSIENDSLEALADGIPYKFHDIRSFADLYYNKSLDKLYAVTTFCSDKETVLNVYSINLPIHVPALQQASGHGISAFWKMMLAFGGLLLLGMTFWYIRKNQLSVKKPAGLAEEEKTEESAKVNLPTPAVQKEQVPDHSFIKILSGFSAYDQEGNSISKKFSGLRQELFIILVMNSVNGKNGISSEYLVEYFWSDKNAKDAKNNKNVNVSKLKELLKMVGGLEVVNNSGYLKLKVDESVAYIDYVKFCNLIKEEQLSEQNLAQFKGIAEGLSNIRSLNTNDWYDKLKAQVTTKLLEYISARLHQPLPKHMVIDMCSVILKLDTVNEEAMSVKCQFLVEMGRHSSARATYDKFVEEYKTLFAEEFDLTFKEVLKESFSA
ncbi:hypothetical protein [Persicobacter diffluens]|uniref:Uncharacterized protein n=1 Tax=Persicobacter diffluens TaxID=981 RepID=A0AAN4W1Y1_9BACT|nr:hypothetical protein PEDI_37780 [Persicobacter diffluens]